MSLNKTLIGNNHILFLTNDPSQELELHCNGMTIEQKKKIINSLSRYTFKNFILFLYPNKSLIYKDFLPQGYEFKYRDAFFLYKKKLQDNIHDLYEILKNESDVYYKTDTHINIKGNYIVYNYFIDVINNKLNLKLITKEFILNCKKCELKTLSYGIGDLTWSQNLGDQKLIDITDNFYYNKDYINFYCIYKINNQSNIRFLDYQLNDITLNLENSIVDWNIISKHIINVKNNDKVPLKVLVFYDSFLLACLPLYFDLFNEIHFIKAVYCNNIIDLIKPDFVFEFRVERFLF